jgi:hypothetical protein
MRVKGRPTFPLGFLQFVLYSQFLRLPSFAHMDSESHPPEQAVEMFLPYLDRTKGHIPLAAFLALARDSLHILNDGIRERQHLLQLGHNTRFGFPSAARRWREPVRAVQAVSASTWSAPLPETASAAHSPSRLNRCLNMIGCLRHEVAYRLFGTNHAEAFKLAAWINADDQGLIVRFLLVAQLDVEHSELVAFRLRFACFEQVAGLCRCAGHEWHTSAINNWDTHEQGLPFSWSEPG